mmetsp:Transcript_8576/g.15356  ORF Transcript_8576/g.15356 Transcript_8576/m.15356 type:complete len:333 (+) Transcript_8576:91-1089(+)
MALGGNAVVLTLACGLASMSSWIFATLDPVTVEENGLWPEGEHPEEASQMEAVEQGTAQAPNPESEVEIPSGSLPSEVQLGLTSERTAHLLEESGPNEVPKIEEPLWNLLLRQFIGLMPFMLEVCCVVLFGSYPDFGVILAMLVINAALGFCEEFKAKRDLEELTNPMESNVTCIHDGSPTQLGVTESAPVADIIIPDEAVKKDLLASFNDEKPPCLEASPAHSTESEVRKDSKKAFGKDPFVPTGKLFLHAIASPCRSRVHLANTSVTLARGNLDVLCSPYPKALASSPEAPPRASPATEPCKRAGSQRKKQEWKPCDERTPARQPTPVEA